MKVSFPIVVAVCFVLIAKTQAQIDPIVFQTSLFATKNISAMAIGSESVLMSGGSQSIRAANLTDIYATANVSLVSVQVAGELALGGHLSQKSSQIRNIRYFNEPLHDFMQHGSALSNFSLELSQQLAHGSFQRLDYNHVTLTGADPVINFFDADYFYFNDHVNFNVPVGSIAIVNVRGMNPNFSMLNFNRPNDRFPGIDPRNLLINFPDVLNLGVNSSQIGGSILAPRASVMIQATSIYGSTVASDIQALGSDFYARPFRGTDRQIVTEPLSSAGFLLGGLMILAMFRKLFVLDTV